MINKYKSINGVNYNKKYDKKHFVNIYWSRQFLNGNELGSKREWVGLELYQINVAISLLVNRINASCCAQDVNGYVLRFQPLHI